MILIGIGSNLAHPPAVTPQATAEAALAALPGIGLHLLGHSGWYLSEPVPASDQPWFANGVAIVASGLAPATLLQRLLTVETAFGRTRGAANAARTLDLDLLDHDSRLCDTAMLTLPHPRLHQRRFVLAPLCEVAPGWRHPRLGLTAAELLDRLPPGQPVVRLAG
ncbi:MAG TPA: 2-amino-4-hydroxy-6-hydroxymethyldihydropteridine diphosphokinase [Stellaceae bacterium]|nr:2-amino-4-hydroxy-6-hydroxymethyldihydropteridine diphosphokinase [Stellaceae bacterium]